MGQTQQKRRAVLIVEDDAELRSLTAALFEDEQVDIIEHSGRRRDEFGLTKMRINTGA
jgi:CheY-like chemotaxis protein